MFTILENYKALLKMCVSAQMAGVEAAQETFNEVAKDGVLSDTEIDQLLASSDAESVKKILDYNGYFAETAEGDKKLQDFRNGQIAQIADTVDSYRSEQATAHLPYTEYKGAEGVVGAGGVVGAMPIYDTVNTVPLAANNNIPADHATTLSYMGTEEGSQTNIEGTEYVVKGGQWVNAEGISGAVDNSNVTTLTDAKYENVTYNLDRTSTIPVPENPADRVEGVTYTFTVNGETKHAIWMNVQTANGTCLALSEPPTYVYETGNLMDNCNYYVCEGGSCGQVARDAIPTTYVVPTTPYYAPPIVETVPYIPPVVETVPYIPRGQPITPRYSPDMFDTPQPIDFLCDGLPISGKYVGKNAQGESIYVSEKLSDGSGERRIFRIDASGEVFSNDVKIPRIHTTINSIIQHLIDNPGKINSGTNMEWTPRGKREEVCSTSTGGNPFSPNGGPGGGKGGLGGGNASAPGAGGVAGEAQGGASY